MLTRLACYALVMSILLGALASCVPLNKHKADADLGPVRFTGEPASTASWTVTETATGPDRLFDAAPGPDAAALPDAGIAPVSPDAAADALGDTGHDTGQAVPDAAPGVCPMLPTRSYDATLCTLARPRADGLDCWEGVHYRDLPGGPELPCLRIDGLNRHIYVQSCADCYWMIAACGPCHRHNAGWGIQPVTNLLRRRSSAYPVTGAGVPGSPCPGRCRNRTERARGRSATESTPGTPSQSPPPGTPSRSTPYGVPGSGRLAGTQIRRSA